ncbi:MAG: amino acid adenylation domain-containing protein [Candidatus Aminicenantes bacterium]|jgi:tyrocidine synthetase-3
MNGLKKTNRKDIEDIIALTPTQEGMLYHYLKDHQRDYYFEQLSFTISGAVDFNYFKQAWDLVIETNEMLRTRFRWNRVKKPVQIILKKHPLQAIFHDFSRKGMDENYKGKLLEEIKDKDRKNRFDLNAVPFRVTLCKIDEYKYEMIISNHHILYDGWSNRIILKEFFSFYHDLVQKKSLLKPHKHKYKEYINWIQGQEVQKQREYWTRYLKNIDTRSELSIKRRKGKNINTTTSGNSYYKLKFSQKDREKLEIFTKRHQITLACLFYSAWGILLQRYNNCEDVIFGTTVSGRSAAVKGIEDIVGLFINTIPLRVCTHCHGHEQVKNFLNRVNKELQERQGYESASLVEIKEYGQVVVEEALFDTIFVIENYPLHRVLVESNRSLLSVDSYSILETTHYDLTVGVTVVEDIEIEFTYKKDLFEESLIKELPRHFVRIVESIIDNPGKEVLEVELLSEAEKNRILYDFNRTGANYPMDKTIHGLFADQAGKIPDNIAVIGEETSEGRGIITSLTYKELNEKSLRLAWVLIEKGVKPDTIVGIMMERSVEMMVDILAILKAGGAYMPIDPDYPEQRLNFMLKDSNTKILVSEESKVSKAIEIGIGIDLILLDKTINYFTSLSSYPSQQTTASPSTHHIRQTKHIISTHLTQPTHLCYIIYTSGTTGKPRGVMVEHSAVMNRLFWVRDKYRLNERDVILQATSFVFDVSVCEMFRWIPGGGKLCLLPAGAEKDPGQIVKTIACNGVTTADFIPAMLTLLLEDAQRQNQLPALASLRWVWTGVEVVELNLVKRFNETLHHLNRTRLINAYGPTESTVDVTYFDCSPRENHEMVPIGRPMANVRIYILSINGAVQPVGVYGQLGITGKGLARGYLNNPELTNSKFQIPNYQQIPNYKSQITNKEMSSEPPLQSYNHTTLQPHSHASMQYHSIPPHSSISPFPHSHIYLTGDLARWLSDGNIQFLGRMDHQVKIRGHRVELGEIETHLLKNEKIKDTVVNVSKGPDKGKYLCAYIISKQKIDISSLRDELSLELPNYMVPSYIQQLDKLPLTSAGKVDRSALPEPGVGIIGVEYTSPVDDVEEKLASIWSDVLNLEKNQIGTGYNFFKLGGHSLKVIRLISGIQKELNIEVPMAEIFKFPTIRALAVYIKGLAKQRYVSVKVAEEKESYALASVQKRLYFLQKMDENATAYNMSSLWLMEGVVDKKRLEGTLKKLIQRHESLRTSFQVIDDEPVQVVHKQVEFEIEGDGSSVNGQGRGEVSSSIKVEEILQDFIQPFDLSRAPLLRVRLIKEGEQRFLFMVDMHHIISDGISVEILIKEFMAFWVCQELPVVKLRYRDYSAWQKQGKQKERIKRQQSYWFKQFEGEVPVLDLPMDYSRPTVQNFAGCTIRFEIDKDEAEALKSLAREQDVTLFMLLLSLYHVFLCKLSGQEDIVVGTPIAGRHTDFEGVMGMFVNTLALRNFPVEEKTFDQFLGEIKKSTIKAFENQDYLYEDLIELVAVERDTARNPLFDTMFVRQNRDVLELEIPELKIQPVDFETHISKFDLSLTAIETERNLLFTFQYCTALFREETIRRFIGHFNKIISTLLGNPWIKISEIEMVNEEEKKRILYTFNNTGIEYPRDKTMPQLLARQVERTPDNIALVGPSAVNRQEPARGTRIDNLQITYLELNKKSDQLADYLLKEGGVAPDTIVGIMVEPSLEMIIALWGILKAGGAYLPIDPAYPQERINYMLKDSSAKILVTDADSWEKFERLFIVNCQWSMNKETTPAAVGPNPQPASGNSRLAYIIYTSGSTGKSKGVMVEHRSAVNVVTWFARHYHLDRDSRVLQLSAYTFDASVNQIFASLLQGAALYLVSKELKGNLAALRHYIEMNHITLLHAVPLLLKALLQGYPRIKSVKTVISGGDRLEDSLKNKFLEKGYTLYNQYGPTETTVDALAARCHDSMVNLGRPIANVKCYILDRHDNLLPVGIPGELFISGTGVSRGYLNNPELTAWKFDPDFWDYQDYHDENNQKLLRGIPDASRGGFLEKSPPGRRRQNIYKTGDLVRWLPEGNIEFLGRMDDQVKISGFRIEPGEIEARLLSHQQVKEALVVPREASSGDKCLCAYIVPRDTHVFQETELRHYLVDKLPVYMLPAYFVILEKIPLNFNGKVDRKALPEPNNTNQNGNNTVLPANEIENTLVDIWAEILNQDRQNIGVGDNFFQLGGSSLKMTGLSARLNQVFSMEIPMVELFKNPTIKGVAHYIAKAKASGQQSPYSSIPAVEMKEFYPLSSAQQRLYILQQKDLPSTDYNMTGLFTLEGKLDQKKIRETFHSLIKRHEPLRTSFFQAGEQVVQRIDDNAVFNLNFNKAGDAETIEDRILEFIAPFDLRQAPLLRVELIQMEKQRYLLLCDMHHIISDGISMQIMLSHFIGLYQQKCLEPLRVQFKDYAAWQDKMARKTNLANQEAYWLNKLHGFALTRLSPDKWSNYYHITGGQETRIPGKVITEKIQQFCSKYKVTRFMFMMAIFNIVLAREIGQTDITIAMPYANREHVDLQNMIGIFLNLLLIRTILDPEDTFYHTVVKTKENVSEAISNSGYPYELLDEKIRKMNDWKEPELFTILFNYLERENNQEEITPGMKITPLEIEKIFPKYDLTLYVRDNDNKIEMSLVYKSNRFNTHRLKRIMDHLLLLQHRVMENEHITITDLCLEDEMVTEETDCFARELGENFENDDLFN